MSWFDIIFAIPLLWACYHGFKKGLVIELASLVALLFGIYGAIGFSDFTRNLMEQKLDMKSEHNGLIAFCVTFLAIVALVYLLANLLERALKITALGIPNKIAGGFFGLLKVGLILSGFVFLINHFDTKGNLISIKTRNESYLYEPLSKAAPKIFPSLEKLLKQGIKTLEQNQIGTDNVQNNME